MEEEQEFPVNEDDLRLVAEANPNTDACPSCSFTNWYIVQGPGMALPVLPMGTPDGSIPSGKGHALVTLACQRCGHIKSHIKVLFDGYVKGLKGAKHEAD